MSTKKFTLKDFIREKPIHTKKKAIKAAQPVKKEKKDKRSTYNPGGIADAWYTTGSHGAEGGSGSYGGAPAGNVGIGESLILELLAGITPGSFTANVLSATSYSKNSNNKDAGMTTYPSADDDEWAEEEPEMKVNKVDQARQLFQALYNRPNATRADIINSFMKDVGVTNSTAVSYYTRFLDEFGLSSKEGEGNLGQGVSMGGGMGDAAGQGGDEEALQEPAEAQPEMEEPADPNRAGIIRTVNNAHLIYKRQEEDGAYEELWIFNIHDSTNDEMDIRRDILAGTDIPAQKTKSLDGQQSYSITTMGNAQMLKVSGLPN